MFEGCRFEKTIIFEENARNDVVKFAISNWFKIQFFAHIRFGLKETIRCEPKTCVVSMKFGGFCSKSCFTLYICTITCVCIVLFRGVSYSAPRFYFLSLSLSLSHGRRAPCKYS